MPQTAYLALKGSNPTYGMLSDKAEALFGSLAHYLANEWKTASAEEQRVLARKDGCLGKLSAFLMQSCRMKKYHDALLSEAANFNQFGEAPLPISISFVRNGREQCADFESLLLQGRAALDRVTWYITALMGQQSSSFTKLEKVLRQSRHAHAPTLLALLSECRHLELALVRSEPGDALRDFVAHKAAASEIMSQCFGIYYFGENLALISDCELGDKADRVAVLRSSHALTHELPFIILNTLAVVCELEKLAYEEFVPKWVLQTVPLSDFVRPYGMGGALQVVRRTTPSGFEAHMVHFDPRVLEHRVTLAPGPSSFALDLGAPA